MPRLNAYTVRDRVPGVAGDGVLLGVVDMGEADRVPAGYVSAANNVTFRDGTARTRLGSFLPSHCQAANLGQMLGSGIYSDPREVEWMLIAEAGRVVQLRDGRTPREISIPETIDVPCKLVQGFDEVLLFRSQSGGVDRKPWRWSGIFGQGFEEISQVPQGVTRPIPNGADISTRPGLAPITINSRMVIPHERNKIAVSDVEDFTRYDAAFADFNLAAANDDRLVGLLPIGQTGLLCLKDGSVALVTGFNSTLAPALTGVQGAPGCVAGATARNVGDGIFYLGERGVWRVGVVAATESRMGADAAPASAPVDKIFRRINWRAAGAAVAETWDEYYFLAVPLDGATRNNAILPYNTRTKSWEGVHTFAGDITFDALHVTDYMGERRLYGVDYQGALVHLLYHDVRADVLGDRFEIPMSITTGGYTFAQAASRKSVRHGKVHLRGWWPRVSVGARTDAVNDAMASGAAWAPNRTKYKQFGKADFDVTNVNEDHAVAGRQDYSIDPGDGEDDGINPDPAGVDFNLEQVHELPITVRAVGRYVQVTVSNDRGVAAVTAVELEGVEIQRKEQRL
jgi:hypothetical protein